MEKQHQIELLFSTPVAEMTEEQLEKTIETLRTTYNIHSLDVVGQSKRKRKVSKAKEVDALIQQIKAKLKERGLIEDAA